MKSFLRYTESVTMRAARRFSVSTRTVDVVSKGYVSPMRSVPAHIRFPEYAYSGQPYQSKEPFYCYSQEDIPKLRKSARLARYILEYGLSLAKPGVTTDFIDKLCHEEMIKYGAYPSPLNYMRFPKSICTSVNEVVCHGIPDDRELVDGDTISIDISLYLNGFHGDNCGATVIGSADPAITKMIDCTREAVLQAVDLCKPGRCISEIGKSIEKHAKSNSYEVIHEFCGHGTGKYLHMQPFILHFANKEKLEMKPGMVFTIEPIFVEGSNSMFVWPDNWTVSTRDGGWAAQIEHEVLITNDGAEILTVLE